MMAWLIIAWCFVGVTVNLTWSYQTTKREFPRQLPNWPSGIDVLPIILSPVWPLFGLWLVVALLTDTIRNAKSK